MFVEAGKFGHANFYPGDKAKFFFRTTLTELDDKEYTVKAVKNNINEKPVT